MTIIAAICIIGLVLFALSTILGWAYYGESCARFLFGHKLGKYYRYVFVPPNAEWEPALSPKRVETLSQ